jgi:SAM-dependent methyltransferase
VRPGLGITLRSTTRRQYGRCVSFDVAADAYNRFMGRYSGPLSSDFADWAGVRAGERALDVGCGPGALTRVLVDRLGVDEVSAVDPSPPFVTAVRQLFPTLDVQLAVAERLPYPDDLFDHALAQLVVHFMTDPVGGLQEMARVVRPGGIVSACVWDFAGERGPISVLWRAARELDPEVVDESDLPGARPGDLERLCHAAGLVRVESGALEVVVHHEGFEQWWEPFTLGVGPSGAYVTGLTQEHRSALHDRCRSLMPEGDFDLTAHAWAVRAHA